MTSEQMEAISSDKHVEVHFGHRNCSGELERACNELKIQKHTACGTIPDTFPHRIMRRYYTEHYSTDKTQNLVSNHDDVE